MRRHPRSVLWLAAYGVCVVLVLSFIVFEVLDVDGSDFPSPMPTAATLKVAEPAQDLRRVPLPATIPDAFAIAEGPQAEQAQARRSDASTDVPAHTFVRRASRSILPRALLADPAASA